MNGQEPDEELGLEHLFRTYFPIESPNHEMKIEYAGYSVDPNDVYAMKSIDAANYMKRNFEMAKGM